MHAATITEFSWRISLPRSQSRRRPKNAFRQRRRFSGLRESHRRDVAILPDANLCFLHFVEPLARCRPAGVRRRPFRIHATNYEHACQTMEGTSARGWVWPFVPGPLQVFSRGNRGLFLPSRPLCRAKRACAANLVARAEDWLWSSLRRAERDDPAFPNLSDWPLPRPSDWLQIVNQPQSEAELDALRRAVRRGCPFGSAVWTAETAKQLKIDSTLHPLGRPRKEQ